VGFGSPLFRVVCYTAAREVNMSRWLLPLMILVAGNMFGQAQAQESANSEAAIRAVLQAQVEAWNHHDLQGFMTGYWNSPELTFFSGGAETKGWQPTLERYKTRYQAEGRSMGTLSFSDLTVEMLSNDAAFARGRFEVVMPDGKQPRGVFTLIFRKFPEGWRIIHDHTCAE
jgi:ketosteroid isomerase-like protein